MHAQSLKVWWPDVTLFYFIGFPFIHTIHSHTKFLHPLTFAEAPLHSINAEQLSGRHLPGVPTAESGFELGPALKRADLPPTDQRRTLLSHTAPAGRTRLHSYRKQLHSHSNISPIFQDPLDDKHCAILFNVFM
jgi:hypothetical protein